MEDEAVENIRGVEDGNWLKDVGDKERVEDEPVRVRVKLPRGENSKPRHNSIIQMPKTQRCC